MQSQVLYMKLNNMRNKFFLIIEAGLLLCLLAGCGRDAALDKYKENMEGYFANIAEINYEMNGIDVSADNYNEASEDLLRDMERLNSLTSEMAEFEVPEQFALTESLADEAAENMSQSLELYKELFSDEQFNPSLADGAFEYYERANKRIGYIKSILQGNIPDELQISYGEEPEKEENIGFKVTNTEDGSEEYTNTSSDNDNAEEEEYTEEYSEGEDTALQYLDVED